jgi:8-oxo-dGTP pyrophosphatase MutT (NUDIX family)
MRWSMPLISKTDAQQREFDPKPPAAWVLSQDGADWKCESERFGSVKSVVVADDAGKPLFERPQYNEAPHIITVPWGGRIWREAKVGLVLETRQHAQHPTRKGDQKFWGVPRGFLKSGETPEAAARREAGEEAGVKVVRNAHFAGHLNPNPTFVGTFGPVIFLEVDLRQMGKISPGRNEKIYKSQFFPLSDVKRMVNEGSHEGGLLEDGVSLAALMKFFCWFE